MVSEEECKPNELHYLRALEAVGSDPDNAWAIGDSRAKDLEPAARPRHQDNLGSLRGNLR